MKKYTHIVLSLPTHITENIDYITNNTNWPIIDIDAAFSIIIDVISLPIDNLNRMTSRCATSILEELHLVEYPWIPTDVDMMKVLINRLIVDLYFMLHNSRVKTYEHFPYEFQEFLSEDTIVLRRICI